MICLKNNLDNKGFSKCKDMKDIFFCIAYMFLSLAGLTFIKMGGQSPVLGFHVWHFVISIKTFIGIFFYGLSFLLYTFVISKMQLSIIIPLLTAINCIAIVIIGITIFKEVINLGQIIGISFVLIGVFVMGLFSK